MEQDRDKMIPILCANHHKMVGQFNGEYLIYWCKECRAPCFVALSAITHFPRDGTQTVLYARKKYGDAIS